MTRSSCMSMFDVYQEFLRLFSQQPLLRLGILHGMDFEKYGDYRVYKYEALKCMHGFSLTVVSKCPGSSYVLAQNTN